jgi:Tol biopolymer transport system component
VRLGATNATFAEFSPDGKWVLTLRESPPPRLVLLPAKAGESRVLEIPNIGEYFSAGWFPDGKRILFTGAEPGHARRAYVWDLTGGQPTAVDQAGAGVSQGRVSPDGRMVAAAGPDRRAWLYPLAGGSGRPVEGSSSGDVPIRWTGDGQALYVARWDETPPAIYRLELSRGRRTRWKQLVPPDPAGVYYFGTSFLVTPDGRSYSYSFYRLLSELYLADGMK